MVASSRSENLNPQYWKQVRVLESEGTSPAAQSRENIQEKAECTQNAAPALGPAAAGNQIAGHVVEHTLQESVNPLGITPQAQTSIPMLLLHCLENEAEGTEPLAVAAPTVAQTESPTTESVANELDPQVSGDKLQGYVPKYFLKEDGKHDDSH
jgi:hypothetical protein